MSAVDYIGKEIAANYFQGIEAVGGKIKFDEQGFTFTSHSINIQRGSVRIDYANIWGIKKRNTLGFVPNGISVLTRDGIEHKFVVNKRESILSFLASRIRP